MNAVRLLIASRLQLFIDSYALGETAPEPMVSCHGGTRKYEDAGTSPMVEQVFEVGVRWPDVHGLRSAGLA